MIVMPINALDTGYEQGSVATTSQKARDSSISSYRSVRLCSTAMPNICPTGASIVLLKPICAGLTLEEM